MRDDVSQMKWWGWGDEHKEFDASDKPFLMPFITRELGPRVVSVYFWGVSVYKLVRFVASLALSVPCW